MLPAIALSILLAACAKHESSPQEAKQASNACTLIEDRRETRQEIEWSCPSTKPDLPACTMIQYPRTTLVSCPELFSYYLDNGYEE